MLREILATKGIRHLRGAYCFGDNAPYTCWDGFRADVVDDYLMRMERDGFNCIIILVPGALPEIEVLQPEIADFFWDSFSVMMKAAEAHGLYVLLRLNYIWDRFPVNLDRYGLTLHHHLPSAERERLNDFLARLYKHCMGYNNFLYAFTTWEDATMYLVDYAPSLPAEARETIASRIGYSPPPSAAHHGRAQIVPKANDPSFKDYLEFVDGMLVRFYHFVQNVFPRLSIEVRCDIFPFRDIHGKSRAHVHARQYDIPGLDIVGTYYGIYMGVQNRREQISAEKAFEEFLVAQHRVLSHAAHLNRPLVFVDQFLFSIRECQFSHFAWMDEQARLRFIEMCADWMRSNSVGYAVWSFQDYLSDQISNSAFSLGLEGWMHSGSVEIDTASVAGCAVAESGAVWQLLPNKLSRGVILIEVQPLSDSEIELSYGEHSKLALTLPASGQPERVIRTFDADAYFLAIKVITGKIRLLKASIGEEWASHGAYGADFAETATTAALRKLNRALGDPRE